MAKSSGFLREIVLLSRDATCYTYCANTAKFLCLTTKKYFLQQRNRKVGSKSQFWWEDAENWAVNFIKLWVGEKLVRFNGIEQLRALW